MLLCRLCDRRSLGTDSTRAVENIYCTGELLAGIPLLCEDTFNKEGKFASFFSSY